MNNTVPAKHVLEVARQGSGAYMRVTGRATFAVASALKKFGTLAIDEGCSVMVVEASACKSMDSTFLGVLAGLASRLSRRNRGALLVANVSESLFEIMNTLGLNQLMECRLARQSGPDFPTGLLCPAPGGSADISTVRDTMLEAHADLAAISPENSLRFKDVMEYLKPGMNPDADSASGNGIQP